MDEKDRRYKIMNQPTMGWTLFAAQAQNLGITGPTITNPTTICIVSSFISY